MAEKDIAEKILESYNDVFADIINVFVFNGRQVVKSESLRDALLTSQYKMDGKLREQERDVAKFWDNKNIRLVMLGLENQSIIDKDMPLRVMGYDGAAYRNQLNMDEEVESKNGKKYRKRNPRYPVITLVLHFGMKKWKKPISLLDTFSNMADIPVEMRSLIHDYSINVVDIAHLSMEQVKLFKSDFKYVAEYLVCKRLHADYKPDAELLKHKDEVLNLMKIITGDNRYEEVLQSFSGEERISMCEVLDKIEKKGIQQGIKQGIQQGSQNILIELVKDNIISISEAAKRANMNVDEFSKLLK